MTKVLRLGRNQEQAEIFNYFQDKDMNVAGTWSKLYEGNEEIENQNPDHIKIIASYLINHGFSRSGEHLLHNYNLLWSSGVLLGEEGEKNG